MSFGHALVHLIIQEVESSERGSATKLVRCEQCGKSYTYEVARTGWGRGTTIFFVFGEGQRAAFRQARQNLARALETGCEPVPCPACGWYQNHMIPRARRLRHRWMKPAGLAMIPVAVLLGLAGVLVCALEQKAGKGIPDGALLCWALAGMAAVLAPGLPALKHCLCRHYDPNNDLHAGGKIQGKLVR